MSSSGHCHFKGILEKHTSERGLSKLRPPGKPDYLIIWYNPILLYGIKGLGSGVDEQGEEYVNELQLCKGLQHWGVIGWILS